MGVQITIRDIPESVRDELAARAASEGRSMQEYLYRSLVHLASKPTRENWLESVRRRKRYSELSVTADDIVQARDLAM